MTREEAHKLVDSLFDAYIPADPSVGVVGDVLDAPARVLPEGKRVVRTKSSGDRVYYLDEDKKTRQWITNPDVLSGLGFQLEDVTEIDDSELLKFQMSAALYRLPDNG